MVRPILEYANAVWCLYKKVTLKQLKKVEKSQKAINIFKASILQREIKTASASYIEV